MHKIIFGLLCTMALLRSGAQKGYGIEQDYYLHGAGNNSLVPCVYYQSKQGWYGQLRYNYEEVATASFQCGKTFSKAGHLSWSVTPLAGLLAGRFTGLSGGVLAEVEVGNIALYSSPQFCKSLQAETTDFFYNWTELSVRPVKFFFTGAALQHTIIKHEGRLAEPGLLAGFTYNGWEIPLYFFQPSGAKGYWVMGLHWRLAR